jgi:hypothetical protein
MMRNIYSCARISKHKLSPTHKSEFKRPLAVFSYDMLNTTLMYDTTPRNCVNTIVMFNDGYDCRLKDEFPHVREVIFNNCDENFLYKNICRRIFPNLQLIMSNSSPCEFEVLHRLSEDPQYMAHLTEEHYNKKREIWWTRYEHQYIQPISEEHLDNHIEGFEKVNPTFAINISP